MFMSSKYCTVYVQAQKQLFVLLSSILHYKNLITKKNFQKKLFFHIFKGIGFTFEKNADFSNTVMFSFQNFKKLNVCCIKVTTVLKTHLHTLVKKNKIFVQIFFLKKLKGGQVTKCLKKSKICANRNFWPIKWPENCFSISADVISHILYPPQIVFHLDEKQKSYESSKLVHSNF